MTAPDRDSLKARYGTEQVLVIPAAQVADLSVGVSNAVSAVDLLPKSSFMPRWQAEYQPSWRQLVAYIVLRNDDQLLLTQRLQTQGEARLHSLYSVGVGGHINAEDSGNPILDCCRRELNEEIALSWPLQPPRPVALINDLSNPVSRDHLGVLFVIDLPVGEQVTIRETDKMAGRFLPLKQIVSDYYDRLESWSKLVVNFLVNSGGAISD